MPHINIYVSHELEKELRRAAKIKKLSLSAYFVDLARRKKTSKKWKKNFLEKVIGGWKGDFSVLQRDPPQDADSL